MLSIGIQGCDSPNWDSIFGSKISRHCFDKELKLAGQIGIKPQLWKPTPVMVPIAAYFAQNNSGCKPA